MIYVLLLMPSTLKLAWPRPFFGALSLLLLALLPAGSLVSAAVDGPDNQEEILEQLPVSMESKLVDPLTVEKHPTFKAGEEMRFKLGWSIFTVAKAKMEVKPVIYEDQSAVEITLNTRTNSFADALYRVRNISQSVVSSDIAWSIRYRAEQNEGSRERDITAYFDPEALTARYINHTSGDEHEPVKILPGTFDPLGIVFFVRSLNFEVGDELVIPTSNGKEFFYTVVRVVDKVKRKFSLGEFEAYVLEPDIKDLGGVFKKSPDGKIRFFFSADARKLPLRMESEVAVGRFWAELVDVEG